MNFLAHAYLSFGNPEIIVGNLIADTVRGKQTEAFPVEIQNGIKIHRMIDAFTDKHPVVMKTKKVFREVAGRYDSSFLDVAFDHFLAIDKLNEPNEGWSSFSSFCYTQVEKYADILPTHFTNMYIYMRSEDWLANYHNTWMIERSFERLKRRASYLEDNAPIFDVFEKEYESIREGYSIFFPDLIQYVKNLIKYELAQPD